MKQKYKRKTELEITRENVAVSMSKFATEIGQFLNSKRRLPESVRMALRSVVWDITRKAVELRAMGNEPYK